jgi:hypothetical protein
VLVQNRILNLAVVDGYGAESYPAAYGAAYGMDTGYPSGTIQLK